MEPVADRLAPTTLAGYLSDIVGIVTSHAGPGTCRGELAVGLPHLNVRGIDQAGSVVALGRPLNLVRRVPVLEMSVVLQTGAMEVVEGNHAVRSQNFAEEPGMRVDLVGVAPLDKLQVPFERTTGESRTITSARAVVQRAHRVIVAKARQIASELAGDEMHGRRGEDGTVAFAGRGFGDLVRTWIGPEAGEIVALRVVRRDAEFKQLPAFWGIGTVGVEVAVDPDTLKVTVEHHVTVADVWQGHQPRAGRGSGPGARLRMVRDVRCSMSSSTMALKSPTRTRWSPTCPGWLAYAGTSRR